MSRRHASLRKIHAYRNTSGSTHNWCTWRAAPTIRTRIKQTLKKQTNLTWYSENLHSESVYEHTCNSIAYQRAHLHIYGCKSQKSYTCDSLPQAAIIESRHFIRCSRLVLPHSLSASEVTCQQSADKRLFFATYIISRCSTMDRVLQFLNIYLTCDDVTIVYFSLEISPLSHRTGPI